MEWIDYKNIKFLQHLFLILFLENKELQRAAVFDPLYCITASCKVQFYLLLLLPLYQYLRRFVIFRFGVVCIII